MQGIVIIIASTMIAIKIIIIDKQVSKNIFI